MIATIFKLFFFLIATISSMAFAAAPSDTAPITSNTTASDTTSPMKIVYFHDFEPYSWHESEYAPLQGILVDIMNESLHNQMGINITHSGYPWLRAQVMVKKGDADAFVTAATKARREFTEISSEPLFILNEAIYTRKDHPKIEEFKKIKGLSDIKEYKLLDYIGNGWAEEVLAGYNRHLVPTLNGVFNELVAGKGDLTVQNQATSQYTIEQLGLSDKIVELPILIENEPFYLCIGKKSPFVKILPEFDKTIRQMRESGKLQEIFDRYLPNGTDQKQSQ